MPTIAYALAGAAGCERVKSSDAGGVAPGADTLPEQDERPYGEDTSPGELTAEGVLKDALTQIWEQARARHRSHRDADHRMFEAGDAFRLLGSVGAVRGVERAVSFVGGYETTDGGSCQIEFRGPVTDAQPVREFLEPQLRAASTSNLEAGFELTFADRSGSVCWWRWPFKNLEVGFELTFADGLSMTGDAAGSASLARGQARFGLRPVAAGVCSDRGSRVDAWPAVPGARPDAEPRQHALGSRGHRGDGTRRAAYWPGMAMHRRRPRRVLTALRMLLTEPRPRSRERRS